MAGHALLANRFVASVAKASIHLIFMGGAIQGLDTNSRQLRAEFGLQLPLIIR